MTLKSRLALEGSWRPTSSGWGRLRGPPAPRPPTHLRFMGRTLTATLTDAIAHRGPDHAGSHLPSVPRLPAALDTWPAAPAHFPLCPRPSAPGRTRRPAAAPPALPLSMPRAAPARVIRAPGFGGAREARRGGAGLPGRGLEHGGRGQDARAPPPEVDKSRQIKWPGSGDGVISGKLKTQPHSFKNWGGGKRGVHSNLGPAQGPQSWGQITKNSFSALNKDLALPHCTGVSSCNLRSKKLKHRDYHSLIVGSSSGPLCYSKAVRARVLWTPKFRDTEK